MNNQQSTQQQHYFDVSRFIDYHPEVCPDLYDNDTTSETPCTSVQ